MVKGRQVGERVIAVYQRLSHSACGGIDASVMRDAFGLKALSRFSPQAWDSLTGIRPRPASPTIPGRWVFVLGHVIRTGQVPFAEADELVEFALSSPHTPGDAVAAAHRQVTAAGPPGSPGPRPHIQLVRSPAEDPDTSDAPPAAPGPDDGPGEVVVVGRRAAANVLGIHPDTFKKARRARPVPGEYLTADGRPAWPREALMRWNESRRAGGPSAA
jgi:hypothetical protein